MENAWLGFRDMLQMFNYICMQLFLKTNAGVQTLLKWLLGWLA